MQVCDCKIADLSLVISMQHDGLRRVQKERDVFYEQMVAGNPPPVKRRK